MFKLAVLLSVVAMAVAKPGVYSALPYDAVAPAVNVVPNLYTPTLYNTPAVLPAYRYYNQPGFLDVPYQPQIVANTLPYYGGYPYHPLFKRDAGDAKKAE